MPSPFSKFNAIFSDDEDEPPQRPLPSLVSVSSGFIDPLLSSAAYHIHQAENALMTLKQVVTEDGWKKALKHKSGVVVHMKPGVSKTDKTPIFKGEAIIQGFSPQSIFYIVGMRRLWDEQYDDGNLVENLNDTTSLTYEVTKPTATSKPRDLSLVEKIECTPSGSIIFACTSVETPRIPRIQGRVRSQIKLQGWIFEPLRGGTTPATRVTYVIQENMKGWVPAFAKKSLARRPLVIAQVNDYLQKKAERMRLQHKPSHGSLRSNTNKRPSIMRSNHLEHPTVNSISPTPSQGSILMQSGHNAAPKKHITFANNKGYTPESLVDSAFDPGSQVEKFPAVPPLPTKPLSSTRHLYSSHRHPNKKTKCIDTLKRLSASLDDWTFLEDVDDIQSYGYNGYKRYDCVIECGLSAEQLCSVVHCFGARKIWDEQFKEGHIVERFSQKDYLVHWTFREGDVCAITSIETNSTTGAIYTASTSVLDSQVPPSDCRRSIDLFGWAFLPAFDERGRPQRVHVTFISSHEASLCVAGIRKYIQQFGYPPYIRRVAGKVIRENFVHETAAYQMTYIAKHEPSSSYRARKPGNTSSTWCTDIRYHKAMYVQGFDVVVSPPEGTRVQLIQDTNCIKIYTVHSEMEGKHVMVELTRRKEADGKITCNGLIASVETREDEHKAIDRGPSPVQSQVLPGSYVEPPLANLPEIPKGYVLVPQQQSNSIIILSDELTFNGQQLAVVFIAMMLSYYMGKFACVC
ncbi:hypothetical protein EC973_003991 [Apophysomyces ossiformis]|uniref:START domain-containing protein n=1 Tax=Apophysomyces ossiformis TaxID=679940 RepID=A0A8H7BQ88_9FUNG|nr:hypothetical protein EC973_003991 [Apophysomyces ossiformis]